MIKRTRFALLLFVVLGATGVTEASAGEDDMTKPSTVYDFTVKDIDGKDVKLSQYKGGVLLIVNVASK